MRSRNSLTTGGCVSSPLPIPARAFSEHHVRSTIRRRLVDSMCAMSPACIDCGCALSHDDPDAFTLTELSPKLSDRTHEVAGNIIPRINLPQLGVACLAGAYISRSIESTSPISDLKSRILVWIRTSWSSHIPRLCDLNMAVVGLSRFWIDRFHRSSCFWGSLVRQPNQPPPPAWPEWMGSVSSTRPQAVNTRFGSERRPTCVRTYVWLCRYSRTQSVPWTGARRVTAS